MLRQNDESIAKQALCGYCRLEMNRATKEWVASNLKAEMWTANYRYSYWKMEVAMQDRTGWFVAPHREWQSISCVKQCFTITTWISTKTTITHQQHCQCTSKVSQKWTISTDCNSHIWWRKKSNPHIKSFSSLSAVILMFLQYKTSFYLQE